MGDIALPVPARVGQATAVEQSRAVAEVHAAILVAQQCPRDVQAAIAAMRQSCSMPAMAERAFYKVPRGGKIATDITIHLAKDLARCWGNIQFGHSELLRDDGHDQSEMQAWAWDVQTNTRTALTFIVPHKRDNKDLGPQRLIDMQAIYENNANAGARRLRQCITSMLPPWYVEEAKERCRKTTVDGPLDENGKPRKTLEQRIADAIATFAELGITEAELARKVGRQAARWTGYDLADLTVVYRSIKNGEVSREDEFPPALVTPAEIAAPVSVPVAPSAEPRPEDELEAETERGLVDDAPAEATEPAPAVSTDEVDQPAAEDQAPAELVDKINRQLISIGIEQASERVWILQKITGRPMRRSAEITTQEGALIADLLTRVRAADDPSRALDQVLAERDDNAQRSKGQTG